MPVRKSNPDQKSIYYLNYLHEIQKDMETLLKEGCPYECILNLILEIELAHSDSVDAQSFLDKYKEELEERYHV